MAIELVMPKLGLSMTEGTIIKWLKKEGDVLKKNEDVLEIETEKLTNTVPSPTDGVLLKILYEEGTVIPIAQPIGYIGEPGEKITDAEGEFKATKEENAAAERIEEAPVEKRVIDSKIKIAPVARALAEKLNIDYSQINGTGPNGRIIKKDIIAYSEAQKYVLAEAALQIMAENEYDVIPYTGMRKAIGVNMSHSWSVAPRVTHHVQVDVTEILELRKKLNSNLKVGQVKLTVTDMFTKIVAKALKAMPIVNSTLEGETVKLLKNVNIGIAVALENGLIVPVVKNADRKDIFTISKEIKELTGKAKNSDLKGVDTQGGTFTISNVGGYGSVDFFSPIINQPESAILGICRTKQAPVVINNEIAIRSMTGLSLTFDHRVVDGAPAAEFLAVIIELLENPARAIFE